MRFPDGHPVSILLHAEFGPNDYREDAFRFSNLILTFLGSAIYFHIQGNNNWIADNLSGTYIQTSSVNGRVRVRKVDDATKCFFYSGTAWWFGTCDDSGRVTNCYLRYIMLPLHHIDF